MSAGIFELAAVMLVASVLGLIARYLKQPLLLAYIASGALIAYLGAFDLIDREVFRVFSDLGIMFLLFLVGLEINYSSLRLVGKASVIIGLGQIFFTALIGYFIARGFDLATTTSLYIALALTFSSTIIIVKLLSEKRDLGSLYGKLSVGMMLVQDAVAIILLVILSSVDGGESFVWTTLLLTLLKAVVLFTAMLWLGRRIFPQLLDRFANSQELFFLLSTGWVLLIAAFVHQLGFSIEIGGFLAGMSLANSSETLALSSRIRPLRDFFILLFFVTLGSSLVGLSFTGIGLQIMVFSLFVLIGNPLIVLVLMGLMGYSRTTSFKTGVTVAQISEFSLILVALGLGAGHVDESVVATVTAVAVVTILFSTYLVTHSELIARKIDPFLKFFEKKIVVENKLPDSGYHKSIVLVGAHRTGASLAHHLSKENLLIIDFDPDVVKSLRARGYDCLLGSISDDDIRQAANLSETGLVISTSPDFDDNLGLVHMMKKEGSEAKLIVRAESKREVELLYEAGVDYVIFPHLSSGHFLGKHIAQHSDLAFLAQLKNNDMNVLSRELPI